MDDFIVQAFLAGLAVCIIAGPLGSLMVWRRMAYFGDTLSHSALLGVAIGVVAGLHINLSILLLCLLLAGVLFLLQRNPNLGSDTLLGILAHTSLAVGLIVLSLMGNVNFSIESYLFGDILAVDSNDLWIMWAVSLVILILLSRIWHKLLSISVHQALAQVEGVNIALYSLLYLLMIASLIAVAIKIIGVLLITALLIIPAATARRFAKTPEQMALFASLIGIVALCLGLFASLQWDTPTGPSIVVAAAGIFFVTSIANFRSVG